MFRSEKPAVPGTGGRKHCGRFGKRPITVRPRPGTGRGAGHPTTFVTQTDVGEDVALPLPGSAPRVRITLRAFRPVTEERIYNQHRLGWG